MKIPEHYNQVMPYLIIKNANEFKKFMETVFDALEMSIFPKDDGSIMHGEIGLGKSVIMFADAGEQFAVMNAGMFVYVEDVDATYQKSLKAGAKTFPGQEPSDKEYGRTCGVIDPFGNTWWMTGSKD